VSEGSGRSPREIARGVLEIEADAIRAQIHHLDERFDRAVALLKSARGRVVCTGMGKSGLVLKKVAATLASTGTPSLFLHPAEAIHGDLGMVVEGDVVLAASYSGRTSELLRLAELVKRLGVPLIALTAEGSSPLASHADLHVPVVIDKEACPLDLAPTASTTATLALGDALAMALLEARGFTSEDFARLHPGGGLGMKLRRVEDLMHSGNDLPAVRFDASLRDAILQMSGKRLGITAVVDEEGRLAGCISDGDLRRLMETGDIDLHQAASECMHGSPRTIERHRLASEALKEMEEHRITSLFVCDSEGVLEGAVHIHDLWRLELF
jgi:arabinose-5-phosphate isomerase